MSILKKKLLRGVVAEPQKFVIYGPQGVGKSELAANAFPCPIFLDTEKGSRRLNVERVPIESFEEFHGVVRDPDILAYQSVIVDTVDWLESLAADSLCREHRQDSIESNGKDSPFAYGKGVVKLGERMMKAMMDLDALAAKGLNVVLLGHSIVRKIDLPDTQGAYDRYELDLNQKHVAPIVKHWCDALLFYNFKMIVRQTETGFGREKTEAVKVRERILYTTHNAAADAKNRHKLKDEEPVTDVASGVAIIKRAYENVGACWGRDGVSQTRAALPSLAAQVASVTKPAKRAAAKTSPAPTETTPQAVPATDATTQADNGTEQGRETPLTDGLQGLAPDNGGPAVDQLAIVLAGHEENALAWLRARGRITATQALADVAGEQRAKILANPARFIEVITPAKTEEAAAA